jgi:3-oxoacyl-[acyl-carrier-protein] synthase II
MNRRVVITGLGTVSGAGLGIEPTWEAAVAGRSAITPITRFDPSGFACRIAGQVPDEFKIARFVPRTYRKATKVMARDIELAVAAADLAARDAKLTTRATRAGDDAPTDYPSPRTGCHIGAGLIAADVDELTGAMVEARDERGGFDLHRWGREGMGHLTPLWLLKYLPNMLACHVTITHGAEGPSNTITCGSASAGLSVGESLRVIQRGEADLCFCGGATSQLNPMAYFRQAAAERLTDQHNHEPQRALRPFCQTATGTVLGEAGAIVTLEAWEGFESRAGQGDDPPRAYAEVVGFGASQSVHRASRGLEPDPEGHGLTLAIGKALAEAGLDAAAVDLIVPFGIGLPPFDRAEVAAYDRVFGDHLEQIPVVSTKPLLGHCDAASGGLDVALGALALAEQTIPARLNCTEPLDGVNAGTAEAVPDASLTHVLVVATSFGGQNAALLLKRVDA